MEPYKFKKIIFNDGLLNSSTDATYIIHLEGNGRYEHIQKQLCEYHPTNIVYILYNKGYKQSKKKPFIINPPLDLVDAFLEVFKHANRKDYNNILILEDDFIFSTEIGKHINIVNDTINNLGNTNFVYFLGCIPTLMIPYDLYHYKIIGSGGTHAVIYSKRNRIDILKINQENIIDWDVLQNKNKTRICYYKPLCYQIFPETENSKYWGYRDNILKINCVFSKYRNKILELDKHPEPGTSIMYFIAKINLICIIIIFIYIIYRFYEKLKIYLNNNGIIQI